MTTIIDIHTHTLPIHPEMAIWNCTPTTLSLLSQIKYASFGLHPWTLSTSSLSSDEVLLQQSLDNSCFIALGEAGLDKLCNTPYELQMQALCFQAKLADKLNIPLILHVVKAHNEVMRLKSELKPRNAWIIHGFRGKPELAQQYLQADFYLSFGERFNSQSLAIVPHDKLLFETDDSRLSILEIYKQTAHILSLSTDKLITQTRQNIDKVFFNR